MIFFIDFTILKENRAFKKMLLEIVIGLWGNIYSYILFIFKSYVFNQTFLNKIQKTLSDLF